jgi:rhodanese-related sulfurtransferase
MSHYAGDLSPEEAWQILFDDPRAVLVDVRTPPEWAFVGVPDLRLLGKEPLFVPWQLYPSMELNRTFAEHITDAAVPTDAPVLFLCRSGARSRAAAIAMTGQGYGACYNIAGGFEGDKDEKNHRGTVSGWKVSGLPWAQS